MPSEEVSLRQKFSEEDLDRTWMLFPDLVDYIRFTDRHVTVAGQVTRLSEPKERR